MENLISNSFFFFKGRVALYAILRAIGLTNGDEVILPGFTCVVVPNAIVYLGGTPVYVDIDPRSFNMDIKKIENKITSKTRAIIAQHTFGIPVEMDKILEIARRYNLYIIEDSCHTIGSKYKDKEVGNFGDAAFFSSQWSKPVTTGLGGWAIINNLVLKEKMKKIYDEFILPKATEILMLRLEYLLYSKFLTPSLFWLAQNTYRKLAKFGIGIGSSSNEELECKMPIDYKKKMSPWQKNLLEQKLKELDRINEHRKWVASSYEQYLKDTAIETVKIPDYAEVVFLRYPILVKNKQKILDEARRQRIEIGDWFVSPVHPNLDGWEKVGYQKGMCPIAEEVCNKVINLPTHLKINEKEAKKIVEFISNYL